MGHEHDNILQVTTHDCLYHEMNPITSSYNLL